MSRYLMVFVLAAASAMGQQEVTGKWALTVIVDGQAQAGELILRKVKNAEDGRMNGRLVVGEKTWRIRKVDRTEDGFAFQIGQKIYTMRVVVKKNTLEGVIVHPFGEMKVTGKRRGRRAPGIVGTWAMSSTLGDRVIEGTMVIRRKDGKLTGTWASMGEDMALNELTFKQGALSFVRVGGGMEIPFTGKLAKGVITGEHEMGERRIPCTGKRQARKKKDEPPEEEPDDGINDDYSRHHRRAVPRDSFDVLNHPEMVTADAEAADDIDEDEPVIGVHYDGVAKAYPISILGRHELGNDTVGKTPIAFSW